MINYKRGTVKDVVRKYNDCAEILVNTEEGESRAINYDALTGDVKKGDTVLINTTAVDLKLGSGGFHYVVSVNDGVIRPLRKSRGHIMKLRYTPLQFSVLSAEEQHSPYHDIFEKYESLDEMPAIIGELHSMLLPAVFNIKRRNPLLKVSYIMTDGGALPLAFSRSVAYLKQNKLIEGTVTYGQAFGGDLETVNIYTALIAAKYILKSDIAVITMGPGITGTGTKYGFSGMEQGPIIDAVNTLGGRPIFIPRISFSDERARHLGISHHSITVLAEGAKTRTSVVVPKMDEPKMELVLNQLRKSGIDRMHEVVIISETEQILENINFYDYKMTTMGRSILEEPDFFLAAGAAGYFSAGKTI